MTKQPKSDNKFSHLLGKGFAHIQDGFDQVSAWAFHKLKDVDTKPKKDEHKIIKASRKVGGFLGEIGSEFYDEYERIKQSRTNRKK